ncbi:olfactory receptor 2D3-like [Lissotriton helveticus]
MEKWNGSSVTGFLLLGLSEKHNVKIILFVLFLMMYMITVIGNIFLITVCVCEPRLHTPMYYFLGNLSFIDICYSLTVVPNLLNQLIASRRMSFSGCAAQMYTYLFLGGTECVLLAVMGYDRYVAILFPLRYTCIINKSACIILAGFCWASGCLVALLDTVFTLQLPLCGNNVIDHFFCEATTYIKMACADAFIAKMVIFSVGIFVLLMPCIFTFMSYIRIIFTIVGIQSSEGRYKAFSTCASHLIVVTIFYGTAIFMYMKPVSKDSGGLEKMVSVFYTVTPPMLNPIIYSMRNKDVKMALNKVLWRIIQHKIMHK